MAPLVEASTETLRLETAEMKAFARAHVTPSVNVKN